MLPNEETTRSDLAARPGELEALLAVAGREQARPIVAFLREQRLNVTLVQDADSAFEEAVLHRPNLVVIHQDLPPAGGIEFCERLKANTRTHFLPTIIFTSGTGTGSHARAYSAGADAVFSAGDSPEERHARLWALLRTQALFRRYERKRESQGLALRERGQWLGSFMHDLQNAVGALQANFDFLTKVAGPQAARPGMTVRPADIAECRDETHALLQQLAHGLRTVQDYERFESGRIGLKEALFAPVELLHEVCAEVRSYGGTAVPAHLSPLVVDDPAGLAPPLPLCTGDRDLLRRGFAALIRLLQRRLGASTVRVSATRGPEGVVFLLGCDGEAIEPTEEAQLFDPYAPSTRKGPIAERFELALARAIVDVHRGRLRVFGATGGAAGSTQKATDIPAPATTIAPMPGAKLATVSVLATLATMTAGFSVELRSRDGWPKSH
jgi:CheY-like chemotaxis protein